MIRTPAYADSIIARPTFQSEFFNSLSHKRTLALPTRIMLLDGCKGDAARVAVGQWYDFHEFGCHLGNVG